MYIYMVIFFLKIFMHESVPSSVIRKISSRNPFHSRPPSIAQHHVSFICVNLRQYQSVFGDICRMEL